MKYTIPYEDKINLPHIKELLNIDLQTGEITKEQEDLVGKVIVLGNIPSTTVKMLWSSPMKFLFHY